MLSNLLAPAVLALALSVLPTVAETNSSTVYPYRNASLCIDERVEDLLSRMSLKEKVGQMYHARSAIVDGGFDETMESLIVDKHISHFSTSPRVTNVRYWASWHNEVQRVARENGLGIPVTLSSNAQHDWLAGEEFGNVSFSRWPQPMGLAALRDTDLARRFADIVREEYRAVGITQALHPQVDLVTEPRWGRSAETMGEDANLTTSMLVELIKGYQGDKIGPHSVITTTKHFPGGGPAEFGEDSRYPWGQEAIYPGDNLDYHLIPFKAAIAAGTRQMMPFLPKSTDIKGWEDVTFAANKAIVTDLLKEQMGFDGIVLTDWEVVSSRYWGMEALTPLERTQRLVEAGCDVLGGETGTELMMQLVEDGYVPMKRIDQSARKLIKEKFELGLFDNPFVDIDAAERLVDNPYFHRLGQETQRRAFTLLTNDDHFLPLPSSAIRTARFYVEGIDAKTTEAYGLTTVDTPDDADYALLRLDTPGTPLLYNGRYSTITNGSIEFNATEKARQAAIYNTIPTVVDMWFKRVPAIPEIANSAAALMGSYGSSHEAFLDVVFGKDGWGPEGKLPFDMPRSEAAAADQLADVPFDTKNPLFEFGHGLRYKGSCALNGCKRRT